MQLLQLQAERAQLAEKENNANADTAASCNSQEAPSTVLDTANSMASSSHNIIIPDSADSMPICSAEFCGMTNANDIVQYMMTVLQEHDVNLTINFHKSLDRLGNSGVWSCFHSVVPGTTAAPGATNKLMRLLKQCEQEASIR